MKLYDKLADGKMQSVKYVYYYSDKLKEFFVAGKYGDLTDHRKFAVENVSGEIILRGSPYIR